MIHGIDEVGGRVRGHRAPIKPAPISAPVAVVCAVGASAALGLAALASMDLYLTGFPDSHLTDYDKAASAPKRILAWVQWCFVPLFVVLALWRTGSRRRAIGSLLALMALALTATLQWLAVPWYFHTHLGLDNGIGG
jgi:hypothetical protein